jgi:pilus assembly protein CpaC
MPALAALAAFLAAPMTAAEPAIHAQEPPQHVAPPIDGKLTATVGKSLIIDSPLKIEKISVANGDLVEAVAINPKEVLINGKAPGETSLIVWQEGGTRLVYDLLVRMNPLRLEAARAQIARDFPDDDISVTYDNDTVFVRGTVKDVGSADRVMDIASTLGKTVNLLRVKVPAEEPQILLKVRFADVDRSTSTSLGTSLASAAFNQSTSIGTGQFPGIAVDQAGTFSLTNALNIFLFRKDLNLGMAIEALEAKNLLQILAEPNLLTISGQKASFHDGGQFPVPVVQGSSSLGTVTIMYKDYGIRLDFLPTVTPRGTIKLHVAPEVSSLDYNNAVTLSGFIIPALAIRHVETDVELEDGQSFVIAGLIDNQFTENLNKLPGLSSLPLLGKLFQSVQRNKSAEELLVLVTPTIVRPLPAGTPLPNLEMPKPFLPPSKSYSRTYQPGIDSTGPVPVHPPVDSIPYEQLVTPIDKVKTGQQAPTATPAAPVPAPPGGPSQPAAAGQGGGGK